MENPQEFEQLSDDENNDPKSLILSEVTPNKQVCEDKIEISQHTHHHPSSFNIINPIESQISDSRSLKERFLDCILEHTKQKQREHVQSRF